MARMAACKPAALVSALLLVLQVCSMPSTAAPVVGVTESTPTPRPTGGPIVVKAIVAPDTGSSPIQSVNLVYRINYQPNTSTVPMTLVANGSNTWEATIPAADAVPGAMVRWYVEASDSSGATTKDPAYATATDAQYYGTIVADTSFNSTLPIFELYCLDPRAPYNTNRSTGPSCSVLLPDNKFHDNIVVRRKGATSLTWPKPKFKIISPDSQGHIFKISPDIGKVKSISMNSEWAEMGENTFMRETIGWESFRQMGVDWMPSYQTVVRLNGGYYGKFSLTVDWMTDSLKLNGYETKPKSANFKSESGEYSNVRWDVPLDQVPYYYKQETKSLNTTADPELVAFAKGIAGGESESRVNYVFDAVNLPKVVNYLAAQALVLNQDRCTKNFNLYLDPSTTQWSMLAWDLESTFGIDRGLGGVPAPDYCILACEQWNSPLYCDYNHPQDLVVTTPWGLITTQINANTPAGYGGLPAAGRKRLLLQQQQQQQQSNVPLNGAAAPGLTLPPNSTIPTNYNTDLTKLGPPPSGAAGTYNFLADAVLNIPRTRAMVVRRLRTLMDQFITTGQLQKIITAEYLKIREEAKRDCAKWGNPWDVDRGYQQLITEQLPIRKQQLFEKYSIGGDTPLIPLSQPANASSGMAVGEAASGAEGYVQILNNNAFSVDVSGWKVSGPGGASFQFIPGTVIPANDAVFIAATSIGQFLQRSSSPSRGQGLFVVGPWQGNLVSSKSSDYVISSA